MNTKFRVEYDFDKKVPYLSIRTQPYISASDTDGDPIDLRDEMVRALIYELQTGIAIMDGNGEGTDYTHELRVVNSESPKMMKYNSVLAFKTFAVQLVVDHVLTGVTRQELLDKIGEVFNKLASFVDPYQKPVEK